MSKPAARVSDMHGCLVLATLPGAPGAILPPCQVTELVGG